MIRNALITSKLIESVKERAMIPDEDVVYDDDKILEILNEKLSLDVVDTLLGLNEEHLVISKDITTTDGRFVIPSRAVGSKLRDLHYYYGGDNSLVEMRRIDLGEIPDFTWGNVYDGTVGYDDRTRFVFYVEGDEIRTIDNRSGLYKMYYHLSPNSLVLESECAQITMIDRTTGIITFSTIPSNFTELSECDVIQHKTPNKILGFDIPVQSVNISQRTITVLPSDIPARLAIKDWVCFPETSPYPNVPSELHSYLAQCVAVYILEAIGDEASLKSAQITMNAIMKKAASKLLTNRVQGANRKLKSRHGFLKQNNFSRRGF